MFNPAKISLQPPVFFEEEQEYYVWKIVLFNKLCFTARSDKWCSKCRHRRNYNRLSGIV
ncbi:unnamed protein product [marine sediment metagenome]|uniref:Uncharacterized protein n=1 Tax=marine sediment metagenome TaxID=412755 RepID=X1HVE9_9ZZZZ